MTIKKAFQISSQLYNLLNQEEQIRFLFYFSILRSTLILNSMAIKKNMIRFWKRIIYFLFVFDS
jgi:hypothetical protein